MLDQKNKIDCWLLIGMVSFLSFSQTIYNLFVNIWSKDDQAYGPILFILAIWLFYVKKSQIIAINHRSKLSILLISIVYIICLILNTVGASQSFIQLETVALPIFYLATVFYWGGYKQVKLLFASIIFLFLMIPLPASIVDIVTQPMKIAVSWAAENLLYQLGYPIAREGVILQIAQYKLLVADACSGLKSLFSLEAFGIAYLMIVKSNSMFRNCVLAALIVPISFLSNTIRIVILALLTYYEGESVAQGFLHQFSGIVLFAVAIIITVSIDQCIQFLSASNKKVTAVDKVVGLVTKTDVNLCKVLSFAILYSMLAILLSVKMAPSESANDNFTLASIATPKIDNWIQTSDEMQLIDVNFNKEKEKSSFYDKVISKSYTNGHSKIMLALAYDNKILQDIKIHQQEVCYVAQGFKIIDKHSRLVKWNNINFEIVNLLTKRNNRIEVVSYYIRIGDLITNDVLAMRFNILKDGLISHRILDGLLVRASQVISDESLYEQTIDENIAFIHQLIESNNKNNQYILTGK